MMAENVMCRNEVKSQVILRSKSGVRQGCILPPISFLLFISMLPGPEDMEVFNGL